MDSDEEKTEDKDSKEPCKIEDPEKVCNESKDLRESKASEPMETQKTTESTTDKIRIFGPMRPPEDYVVPDSYFDQESDRDLPEIEEKDV